MSYDDMADAAKSCKGKIIRRIEVDDNQLRMTFDDCVLVLEDTMQNCCERRYMTCNDPFSNWEGLAFVGYRIENCGDISEGSYGCHDVKFLIVDTFLGSFTVANHNSHNGYYGGFSITAKVTPIGP